jgi:centractin
VTAALAAALRRAGVALASGAEMEVARAAKEALCYASASPAADEAAARDGGSGAAGAASFTLPDGQVVKLGAELFRAAELLFRPSLIGREEPGIGALVASAVAKTDLDLRAPLLRALVLAGGTTAMRGFAARAAAEVRRATAATLSEPGSAAGAGAGAGAAASASARVKVCVWAPTERKLSTWLGGSILASLSTT